MDGMLQGPSLLQRHWTLPKAQVDKASGSLLSDSRGEIPGDLIIEGAQL